MIPRHLHRVVLPPMTEASLEPARNWAGLQRLHPSWAFTTWTSLAPADYPEVGHLLHRCRSAAQRADLIRLEVLWQHGGVYVDTDCEGIRPLDPLLNDPNGFFVGAEFTGMLAIGVIGAAPRHPAVRAYLDEVLKGFDFDLEPNLTTGPHLATRVLADRSDVTVHPTVTFYCEPPNSDSLEVRPTAAALAAQHPEAVLVHRWAHSWAPPIPLDVRARQALGHARWLLRQRLGRSR